MHGYHSSGITRARPTFYYPVYIVCYPVAAINLRPARARAGDGLMANFDSSHMHRIFSPLVPIIMQTSFVYLMWPALNKNVFV